MRKQQYDCLSSVSKTLLLLWGLSRLYDIERECMDIQIGNIVKLKKKHPCGSFEWEVVRIGADFKLKCLGCEHLIMVPRTMVEKNLRGIR